MLSDPPVLTAISPASPIPQKSGIANALTVTGQNLIGLTDRNFNFLLNGSPVDLRPQTLEPCTSTTCTVYVSFAGNAGQFSMTVTNGANQTSNALSFSVQPTP